MLSFCEKCQNCSCVCVPRHTTFSMHNVQLCFFCYFSLSRTESLHVFRGLKLLRFHIFSNGEFQTLWQVFSLLQGSSLTRLLEPLTLTGRERPGDLSCWKSTESTHVHHAAAATFTCRAFNLIPCNLCYSLLPFKWSCLLFTMIFISALAFSHSIWLKKRDSPS